MRGQWSSPRFAPTPPVQKEKIKRSPPESGRQGLSDEDDYPVLMHYLRSEPIEGRECLTFYLKTELDWVGMPKTLMFGRKVFDKTAHDLDSHEAYYLERAGGSAV